LKGTISLSKIGSDYEDYRQQIEKQSDFLSMSQDQKRKVFEEMVLSLKESEKRKAEKLKRGSDESNHGKGKKHRSSSEESGEVSSPQKDEEVKKNGGSLEEEERTNGKHKKKSRSRSSDRKKKKHY